jgi:DNA polymerase-3 subunit epsilon
VAPVHDGVPALMLPCYVVLDLETTGANPVFDRVTEIALVRMEQGVEVARWSTLVNPGVSIPPFIQNLTGIHDAMVADAPPFADVAQRLLQLLQGAVLVAHNVRFDHGFLKNEFERLQLALPGKTLCSVRLSRALYPQHRSHGLDAIMQRHGLHTASRHRAMGDVEVVLAWLQLAAQEFGQAQLQTSAAELLGGASSLPPLLETPIRSIPETAGVYLFYGEGPLPLYIGKSVSMRSRVMAHFQATAKAAKEMRIAQEVRTIQWRETAGELGALLLESRLVKELQPVYNRQLRRQNVLCAWQLHADPSARPLLTLISTDELDARTLVSLYGPYRSKRQAMESLRALVREQGLCPQALGLESGKGRCFAQQVGQCRGLCCGLETPQRHYLRLQLALAAQRLQAWPFAGRVGVREHDPATDRTDLHVFEHWCHLATVQDEAELAQALQTRTALAFDLDTYRLLLKRLQPGMPDVIALA